MDNLQRIRELSGLHPQRQLIEDLKADRQVMIEAYDQLIRDAEQNKQLDEGLFTSLKAAVAAAGAIGAAGAKKVSDKASELTQKTKDAAKKVAANIKELYLDEKAKAELEALLKNLNKAVGDFETMEKDASTIIKRDAEVEKAMNIFKQAFSALITMLGARLASTKEPKK